MVDEGIVDQIVATIRHIYREHHLFPLEEVAVEEEEDHLMTGNKSHL